MSGFAPDYVHLGYDIDGVSPRIFDRDAFWATMARMQAEFDVFDTEVETLVLVGDELVFVSTTVHRRTRDGREYSGE